LENELLVYVNGKYYPKSEAKISVYDHGLLYGDGIFEGIRAYNGVVFKLKEHIDRLYSSAEAIMLQIPMTKEEMIKAVLETLMKNDLRDAYIRLVVTRGVGTLGLDPQKCEKPTVIIIAEPTIALHKKEAREKGITALLTWVRRDPIDSTSHEVKSLNYLNSILAKIEANVAGFDDAIFLDKNGNVSEATGANIFVVKDGVVMTPPTSTGILLGITRKIVMEIAESLGYKVVEKNITPQELFSADEVFLSGTAAEITPVREVNKRTVGEGKPGKITKQIMREFEKLVKDPSQGVPIA